VSRNVDHFQNNSCMTKRKQ